MPRSYLIHPRVLPEFCLHINGGSPYGGKSTLTAQLLRALVDGGSFLTPAWTCEKLQPEDIGLVFCDRPAMDNDGWLAKVGLLGKIRTFDAINYPNPKTLGPEMAEHLLADEMKGVRLLVWETGDEVLGGDIFKDTLLVPAMRRLQALCIERRLTMLMNLYGVKTKASKDERYADPIEQLRGCAALRGKTSTILFVCSEALTERVGCGFQRFIAAPRDTERVELLLERAPDGLFQYNPAAAYHQAWAQHAQNDAYGDMTPEQLSFLTAVPSHPALPVYEAIPPSGTTRAELKGLFQDVNLRTIQRHVRHLIELELLVDQRGVLRRPDRPSTT